MEHTVTISEDVGIKNGVLTRTLVCTCGWDTETWSIKCEPRAKHHLNFQHGGGVISYGGHKETV